MNPYITKFQKFKHLLGFKRLFWRIFIAFWFASLLVMFATVFILVNSFTSSEAKQRHLNDVAAQAEQMAWRYENEDFDANKLAKKIAMWRKKKPGQIARILPMRIVDNNRNNVYLNRIKNDGIEGLEKLTILGPSGAEYTVYTYPVKPPRIFKQVLYRFQSLQFIFILIASALVSALLSLSIVVPLKYIGSFSRRYAVDQKPSQLPEKLLKRGDELGDLAVDIDFMVKKTYQTANAQQQLLHDVSHELRAPLARLQVSAALIEQRIPDNRHALQINNDCLRIDQLIQKILNYSKLEHDNQLRLPCNLINLCQTAINNMMVQHPLINIEFTVSLQKAAFLGFEESLVQALDNLLGNACKYSSANQSVELSLFEAPNHFIITIRDHGMGVDDEEIEQLMKPFYRAGNQMHTQGFGLGLSIAARAIEINKGQLTINNHENGGLLVTIFLPKSN